MDHRAASAERRQPLSVEGQVEPARVADGEDEALLGRPLARCPGAKRLGDHGLSVDLDPHPRILDRARDLAPEVALGAGAGDGGAWGSTGRAVGRASGAAPAAGAPGAAAGVGCVGGSPGAEEGETAGGVGRATSELAGFEPLLRSP